MWRRLGRALLLAVLAPVAFAQSCVPLSGSTQCTAFESASISTNSKLTGFLWVQVEKKQHIQYWPMSSPFLSFVSSTETFDRQLSQYVNSTYVQLKYVMRASPSEIWADQGRYQTLLGCNKVNLSNTTDYYARYATSVICNAIVQNSISPCGLEANATRPLCANDCVSSARDRLNQAITKVQIGWACYHGSRDRRE